MINKRKYYYYVFLGNKALFDKIKPKSILDTPEFLQPMKLNTFQTLTIKQARKILQPWKDQTDSFIARCFVDKKGSIFKKELVKKGGV